MQCDTIEYQDIPIREYRRSAVRRKAISILKQTYPFSAIEDTKAFFNVLSPMKKGALKRGIMWKITDEQAHYIMQQNCTYCGCEPKQGINMVARYGYSYNGMDRKNNKRGYTIGNIVPCCGICNFAKGKQSVAEFEKWVIKIYNHFMDQYRIKAEKYSRQKELLVEDMRE